MNAMRWMAVLLLAGMAGGQIVPPQPELPPELLQLAKIKLKMEENLGGLPNYTCTQVIERSRRDKPTKRYRLIDTVRLEVALVGGKELFSWPGERNFQDRELGDMVGGGAIGNGNFALHAKAVFLSNTANYRWVGEELVKGRRSLRYDYAIPQFRSGLSLRVGPLRGIAGARGSFWVDAETLDLIRLDVHAEDIPAQLPISASSDSLEYARVAIGEHNYLLPKSSEMVLVDLYGNESRNRVELSNCRQYLGESTLVFDEAPRAEAAPAPKPEVFDVPADLDLEIFIDKMPDVEQGAIGDRITGTVYRDARLSKVVVIPHHATVTGRISLLEGDPPGGAVLVGLELTEVEFPGHRGRLKAHLLEAGTFAVLDSGRLLSPGFDQAQRARIRMPLNTRNVFVIPSNSGPRAKLSMRTRWRTEAAPKETP